MGPLWIVVAGFLFACMGVCVKLGAARFSSAELVFYRSLFGLVALYALVRTQRLPLATPNWRGHLWRGLTGLASLAMYFYCITVLPLATAVTLNYSSPLFLALLTTVLLKERWQWPLVGAAALGFAGVALLLGPTLGSAQLLAGIVGVVSGFFAALAYVNVRQLGLKGEPDWRTVFYFTLIATLATGLWLAPGGFAPLRAADLPLLAGLGLSATLAQLALTRAYRAGPTLVVGTLAYSTVLFATLAGILLWDELLPGAGWLGVGLIVAAGMLSLRFAPGRSARLPHTTGTP